MENKDTEPRTATMSASISNYNSTNSLVFLAKCTFNQSANCSLPCYIMKKRKYRNEDEKILMGFKKFNDCQKDNLCTVSSYMEENSCK